MQKIVPCLRAAVWTGATLLGWQNIEPAVRAAGSRAFRLKTWLLLAAGLAAAPAAEALQLTVGWDINSTGQLGFNVERSTDGTNFTQIATVAATVSTYTDLNLPTGSYWYRVRAFDTTTYSVYSNVASTQTSMTAPSFTTQPASTAVAAGSAVSFTVVVNGAPTPSLQWNKNGTAIAGATSATLTLPSVSSSDAATYTAVATNSAGSVTSIGAVLTLTTVTPVAPPPPPPTTSTSRLRNFSARAVPAQGNQTMNVDFTTTGTAKSILVRGIGPGLSSFTSAATFVDPKINVTSAGVVVASNDNWGGGSSMAATFTQVGAFPLLQASKDAAALALLAPNAYSATISGKTGGVAMIEVYDADSANGRISKIDVRGPVGTGEARLIGGFTITGTVPLRVLIRAVGPGLGGGKQMLADPQLELYSGQTLIQRNDNWGGTSGLSTAFGLAGATSLAPQSKDAAMDVTLAPGTYSATVSGVNNTTGVAQLEVYEVQ
ncbi:MAG: immunoglobulin domain-containing protein [Opitutus sp.]